MDEVPDLPPDPSTSIPELLLVLPYSADSIPVRPSIHCLLTVNE